VLQPLRPGLWPGVGWVRRACASDPASASWQASCPGRRTGGYPSCRFTLPVRGFSYAGGGKGGLAVEDRDGCGHRGEFLSGAVSARAPRPATGRFASAPDVPFGPHSLRAFSDIETSPPAPVTPTRVTWDTRERPCAHGTHEPLSANRLMEQNQPWFAGKSASRRRKPRTPYAPPGPECS
jgi:hypothetical protein